MSPCKTIYIYKLCTTSCLVPLFVSSEAAKSAAKSEFRNMSPSKIYQPHDVVATIAYWLERSDGSLPMTNEDSLKICVRARRLMLER